jgi:hypothetical protein
MKVSFAIFACVLLAAPFAMTWADGPTLGGEACMHVLNQQCNTNTPSSMPGCNGMNDPEKAGDCFTSSCVYCDGGDTIDPMVCVSQYYYGSTYQTCNLSGDPINCGHTHTSECTYIYDRVDPPPGVGHCNCQFGTGPATGDCTFLPCTGNTAHQM